MSDSGIMLNLSGVAETLLFPLYARAAEARRPDGQLRDAKAVELVEAIDYPFQRNFGHPRQVIALRDVSFDRQVRAFLRKHPGGTVIALGDGLNTQFRRLDNGQTRWLSIDLPEVIEIRQRLIPDVERSRAVACSALDERWMGLVDPADGVFISAQGLFMYLDENDVYDLIGRCARTFPGGWMMFDAMPRLFTGSIRGNSILGKIVMAGKHSGADAYELPAMPWSSSFEAARKRLKADPNIASVKFVPLARGRGLVFRYGAPVLESIPYLRSVTPWFALLQFRGSRG